MLRTRNPSRTLHFYINLMGMRTVFTMNTGPFTIYYLGYPATSADCADLPAWAARVSDIPTLTKTLGLLEFYHIHGTETGTDQEGEEGEEKFRVCTGNEPPNLGFGHLGFTVPDVGEAVERLRREGVKVVKELGDVSRRSVPLSRWEEERRCGVGEISQGFRDIWGRIACVADPDGYLVELVPQDMELH
ncbi:Glyoxalase/Bleomycin resistance protein/Dihydroxybiphenyl dioxygenase [Aspergillus sclerotioniger CBS 115572]|uniref:Glyoxalase/Bleomycin resistance protein/Dihydroxybiphenyl dioxygenase n=1 Tax=Aspergillus sclerotioniger CBS 115572 TaxID=1450535 RepID=A0A317WXI3_9EURO|nr:Glyoxalase/Bleomycin resistance protein/Dihydroxybiphenyl dioxygenase [Aspergillus sclerotioniger CBS 115572]PWY89498.1 Glyoxalase/Bleomycin resistance protein/Dihydroxybiphenyl dioxygenase [Aspergillus sclerotioniger CBS 115572]